MALKAVFLEFRGVLVDDRALQSQVMNNLLLEQNLCLKPQEYEDLIKEEDDRSCLSILLERRGRTPTVEELNQLLERRFDCTQDWLRDGLREKEHSASGLLPDVKDFLFRVRSLSLPLVLITSSPLNEVNAILTRENIVPYFDLVLTGNMLHCQPIKPWAYTHAIDTLNQKYPDLNLLAQECLAIEPIYRNLEVARVLGLSVAAISRYRPFHFLQRRADWIVDRLTDLDLERINASLTPGRF
ncbi:MAG: HAD family hydrolase [Prochlorotrichaceae cyanobacterium]|jgi:beta-phosphoglucomutase-like phosphatase (HAD superfamily)